MGTCQNQGGQDAITCRDVYRASATVILHGGAASRLDLAGYAKNLQDGRVEIYAIGTDAQLRALVQELRRGPQLASVTDVDEIEAELLAEYEVGFSIEFEDGL